MITNNPLLAGYLAALGMCMGDAAIPEVFNQLSTIPSGESTSSRDGSPV